MNFRDFYNNPPKTQKRNNYSLRDMNGMKNHGQKSVNKNTDIAEQIPVNNAQQINQSMYQQTTNFPQNQSVYAQTVNFPQNQNVYQQRNNIPVVTEKSQDKFLYYMGNNNTGNNIPVPPPPPPVPDPPQPPPPETPTPTPPPKMVKPAPVRRREDDFSMDFGAFGGTFDDNPNQSTIADIPVMNNIDDYKL